MIIDPKKAYTRKVDHPRHLMKGLNRIGVLDEFFKGIKIRFQESNIMGIEI